VPELSDLQLAVLVLACAAVTYLWRGLGLLLSGKVRPESEVFTWVGCVAYAMVAGLMARIILLPSGPLAETLLVERLLACAAALAAYYAARKNMFVGIVAGFGVIVGLGYLRAHGGY
jgi:branched-subunit amino acid transport protein